MAWSAVMFRPREWLPALVAFACFLTAPRDARGDEPPLAVLVGPRDRALELRIEGQVSDLAWRFEREDPDAPTAFAQLLSLGERRAARVVIAFEEDADAIVLEVVDVPGRRRFSRRFEGGSATARREEVAVALRGSLVALALGGEIGVHVSEPIRPEAPPSPPILEPTRTSRYAFDVAVLGQLAVDGLGDRPPIGPAGRVGLVVGRLALGVTTGFAWPRTLRSADAEIVVARSTVALRIGMLMLERDRLCLEAALGAGVVVFGRITANAAAPLVATGRARNVVGYAPMGFVARVFPGRSRNVGLELGLGVDVLFGRPTFSITSGDVSRPIGTAWVAEPRGAVGLVVRTGVR